jgi:hypothetical protein
VILGLSAEDGRAPLVQSTFRLMNHFGLNFKAARRRLVAEWNVPTTEAYSLRGIQTKPPYGSAWYDAEILSGEAYFPCPTVPFERRGRLARRVADALCSEHVDRRQGLELLRAAPDEPIEQLVMPPG